MKDVFFLHMPKTGGLSINEMIQQEGYKTKLWKSDFQKHDPEHHLSPAAYYGHVSAEIIDTLPENIYTFTFLRHPAKRYKSYYNYIHGLAGDGYQHFRNVGFNPNRTFAEFIGDSTFANLRDGMTRQLCGVSFLFDVGFGSLSEDNYNAAKSRLESLDYVGDTDTFAEDIQTIAQQVGWKLPNGIIHTNGASARRIKTIEPEIFDLVREMNPLDSRLYQEFRNRR